MSVVWLFLVVSWSGEIMAYHGFHGAEDCGEKRARYMSSMAQTVRDVTECIGVPLRGIQKPKERN